MFSIFKENHLLEDRELAILPLFFLLAEVGERVQFLLIALLVPTENDFLLLGNRENPLVQKINSAIDMRKNLSDYEKERIFVIK